MVDIKGIIMSEVRKLGNNEEGEEYGAANGLAKVMSPGGELGVGGENV